jgi:hypothetical protein
MKIVTSMLLLPLILGQTIGFAETGAKSENLEAAINYLLSFVEQSDCIFIRNNREYPARQAVGHMQRKYDHFKSKIKSPEDFIRLTATKSLMSGKPYMVKTKAGILMTSETWLLNALETFRQQRQRKN